MLVSTLAQNVSKPKTLNSEVSIVLSIAGSDSSGMAGIAADMRTIHALGAHACSAITATTAQNSVKFSSLNPCSNQVLKTQIESSFTLIPSAIKIGLLASVEHIDTVAQQLSSYTAPIVLDPVLSSSTGFNFSSQAFIERLKKILFPICTVITPNIPEAEKLIGKEIITTDDVEQAAKSICEFGCSAVIIKGGHSSEAVAQDYFFSPERQFWLSSQRMATNNNRGTGCVFSSAIATALAQGYSVYDATIIAKMSINQGLRNAYAVAGSSGPLYLTCFPNQQCDLPTLSHTPNIDLNSPDFPECNDTPLGLYPVVDRAQWLETLLPLGISTAQIRIKDLHGDTLEQEIIKAIEIGNKYSCRLFINDYWELAIKHKAYGVHLGQEDLDSASVDEIKRAGLRLGTSTHCHYEVARAHAYKPSYIAVGPVYSTTTKDMPWIPHGIEGFSYWRKTLNYPLVAIGGINRERIPALVKLGADSIAMITAITHAENPTATANAFMELISESQD